jgi:16S rRNA (uracil1498-N3)-methyltransferase
VIRLFVDHELSVGATVPLRRDQAHYLTNVMRQSEGASVHLFNGRDGEWRATLVEPRKKVWAAMVEDCVRPWTPGPDLDLVIAVVKRGRLETIVEKAAELGARRVIPVLTERTNAQRANLERLRAIAIEAAEQTGRLDAPSIDDPARLGDVLRHWDADRRLMFCDEAGDALPVAESLAREAPASAPWAVLIGPEGGFSPAERSAVRALPGALPVSLGPRILRADTAAIAALTLWQSVIGDWRAP